MADRRANRTTRPLGDDQRPERPTRPYGPVAPGRADEPTATPLSPPANRRVQPNRRGAAQARPAMVPRVRRPRLVVGRATDRGRVRELNEDAVYVEPTDSPPLAEHGLLGLVADGMGGHQAGDVASRLAIETVRSAYYGSAVGGAEALEGAIRAANGAINRQSRREASQAGMGSTLVAAVVSGNDLLIAHVGDSRAYLVRRGAIQQLTVDHSRVGERVAAGLMTREQARNHPESNVLTRALGPRPLVQVDVGTYQLQPGDAVVLCSDGLHGPVTDAEIARLVSRQPPQRAANALVHLANQRGGPDNISVVVLRLGRGGLTVIPGGLPRWWPVAGAGALALLLVVFALIPIRSENEAWFAGGQTSPVAQLSQGPAGASTALAARAMPPPDTAVSATVTTPGTTALQSPSPSATPLSAEPGTPNTGTNSGEQTYTVKRNDNLIDIAGKCNVPLELLAKRNAISDRNDLTVGQQLVIPDVSTSRPCGRPR